MVLNWWQVLLNFCLNISGADKYTIPTEHTNMFLLMVNYEECQI